MRYEVTSAKTVEQALADLQDAVTRNGFGVLHTYDLQATLKGKGFDLPHACHILEVCNPKQAMNVLGRDMGLNVALPCRVSVYERDGKTCIGMAMPSAMLESLSDDPDLRPIADEVEASMLKMIDEAR